MTRNTNDEQLEELIYADKPAEQKHKAIEEKQDRFSLLTIFFVICLLLSVASCTAKDIISVWRLL